MKSLWKILNLKNTEMSKESQDIYSNILILLNSIMLACQVVVVAYAREFHYNRIIEALAFLILSIISRVITNRYPQSMCIMNVVSSGLSFFAGFEFTMLHNEPEEGLIYMFLIGKLLSIVINDLVKYFWATIIVETCLNVMVFLNVFVFFKPKTTLFTTYDIIFYFLFSLATSLPCYYIIIQTKAKLNTEKQYVTEVYKNWKLMMDISPIGLLIIQGGEIIYSNNEAIGLLEKENITMLLSAFEDFISKLEIVNKTKTTCTLKSTSGLYLYYQEKSITFNQVISKLVILNNLTQLFETEQLKTNQRFAEMLISTSTHELRTPLHCIKAVLSENINAVNSQQITKALNACDIQEQCINDILDYAKIKNNSIIINKDTFDIIEFLNEIKYFFVNEFNAKGLYLQLDTLGLSRSIVELDKRRLKQVMFNLISNALKFTFTKGVTIRSFDVNKKLCIQVEDSGIGIEPVDMEKLFTPFGMIKSSSQYNKTGTGLGLYLSQTFCHLMDGHIYSYSVPKVGTTFTICFNIDCLKFGHIPNTKSNSIIIEHSFWYTGRLKALIVDDNPFNCEVLEAMLKKLNIISYKAYSGNDALRIVHNCADIFIGFFDINMPIMDGFTLMSEIFKLHKEMSVNNFPVFAITGDNSEGLQMKCGEKGFKGFISKPFSAKKISEILHWLYPN